MLYLRTAQETIFVERFALKELVQWKNKENRKPLVIMGARQVGKTWLMKEFGKREYKKVAYISFYNNKRIASIFEADYDIKRILTILNAETGLEITPNDTLIIFDEIQNAPKAFESLKYFCEDAPEYHIVVAGSLLGVSIHQGVSYPVGKVDLMNLYPLNFREFLLALDEGNLENLLETQDYTLIDTFADKYLYYLKLYYFVGGMPGVVETFREHRDFFEVRKNQSDILLQYRGDFGKHISSKEIPRINMVWESLPIQLAKENKKFFFGQIKKGARSSEFELAIQWLTDSGLVHKVNKVSEPKAPLAAYKVFNSYKLFIIDVGLLCAMAELDAKSILDGNRLFVEFKGALTEQYVFQQLISDTVYKPYYYGSESATFEQDFIIQDGENIVPIEVKAESNVHSQSLKAFYEKYHPPISVRFSAQKYINQGWLKNIPLYAVCNL